MSSSNARFPVKLAAGLLALAGCIDKGEGPSGDSGEAVADDTATDTGDATEWGWVDGDMGACEGGTGMTSAFDVVETAVRAGHSGAAGPFEIEGNGTICGAACTHDYASVHLWYIDSFDGSKISLPAHIPHAGVPCNATYYLSIGAAAGPDTDIGELIRCQVNTSAGPWTATIEILESE